MDPDQAMMDLRAACLTGDKERFWTACEALQDFTTRTDGCLPSAASVLAPPGQLDLDLTIAGQEILDPGSTDKGHAASQRRYELFDLLIGQGL